jgi:flagellar biosynthesis chaperone FliJ
MAFKYALQSVLRLRASLERQEELRLLAIAAVVARVRAEIEALDQEQLRRSRAAIVELEAGAWGATLQFGAVCDSAYAAARKKLRIQLADAESRRLAQLHVYRNTRQKREILQGLRDHQQFIFDLDFMRHEQQGVDEAFLIGLFAKSAE